MTEPDLRFIPYRPSSSRLAQDYLAGDEEVLGFYGGGKYNCKDNLLARARSVDSALDRDSAAAVLAAQRAFAAVERGEERLEAFRRQRGYVMVTGQQPVLFGGPLYVLYKCATVISLAREAESILGRPVLPVFWNASEDHDLEEAAAIRLPDIHDRLVEISFPRGDENRRPLCRVETGGSMEALHEKLCLSLAETDFERVKPLLAESFSESTTLGAAYTDLLARLFGPLGLFIVEACHPEIRRRSRELFEREIFSAGPSSSAVQQASDRLASLGYHMQIKPRPGDTNLFLIRGGERDKLTLGSGEEGDFVLKRSGEKITRKEIRRLLDDEPESFSPGALMRPLVEAHLFGTLCYAAGPGETAYYAQMRGLYELHGLGMPLIYPRMAGILIEPKIARVLDRYSLVPEDLSSGPARAADHLLSSEGPLREMLERIDELRAMLDRGIEPVERAAGRLDRSLEGPVGSARGIIARQLEKLEKKASAASRRRSSELMEQLGRAALHLWPEGGPQERQTAGIYYLARYGTGLAQWLVQRAEISFE